MSFTSFDSLLSGNDRVLLFLGPDLSFILIGQHGYLWFLEERNHEEAPMCSLRMPLRPRSTR
jgi:hypothetical protein